MNNIIKLVKNLSELNYKYLKNTYFKILYKKTWRSPGLSKISYEEIENMFINYSPVFILSTGRCGSLTLHEIFKKYNSIDSYHEPTPTLMILANYLFNNQEDEELLATILKATRLELIINSYIKNKIYIESNQVLSYIIPGIIKLFNKSKIIHLIRHPGNFIVSAAIKGWYQNNTIWEIGRIKENNKKWIELTQIEKLAWYWQKTNNLIIEKTKKLLENNRYILLKIEDINNYNKLLNIMKYCGLNEKIIKKIPIKNKTKKYFKNDPENMNRNIDIKQFKYWDKNLKEIISPYVSTLCNKYGYDI